MFRNQKFILSARNGDHETVDYLLKYTDIDPSDWDNDAIISASEKGN